jgi:hypothetical protein
MRKVLAPWFETALQDTALQRSGLKLSPARRLKKFLLNRLPPASVAWRALLSWRGCGSILWSTPPKPETNNWSLVEFKTNKQAQPARAA